MEVPVPDVTHYRRNETDVRDIPFGVVDQLGEFGYRDTNIRRPRLRILYQRQPRIMRILPISPQLGGFLVIPCELKSRPTVLLHDLAYDRRGFFERCWGWTLEFEKQAILFWPFSFRHAVFVGGGHEHVVY